MSSGANALCGMAKAFAEKKQEEDEHRKMVFISMFGNTTKAVTQCTELLDEAGIDTLVFHATGTGGRAMEELIFAGYADAVLDMTTTELADELCGGILSAGPKRLEGAVQMGIPYLIVPGCVDMVNFAAMDTVPEKYRDGTRTLYSWGPLATLMRTNVEENRRLGEIFAEKTAKAEGKVQFLLPEGGLSALDLPGEMFYSPEADTALFETIKSKVRKDIPVTGSTFEINSSDFARLAVSTLLDMMQE